MALAINKKTLENLEELARIKIKPGKEAKLLKDLGKILEHFEELKNLDTQSISPMTGGALLKNVFRDEGENQAALGGDAAKAQFPEKQEGFLKIPPVFE